MATSGPQAPRERDLGAVIGELGLAVGVAESLTGGLLANRFARAQGASDWFRAAAASPTAPR